MRNDISTDDRQFISDIKAIVYTAKQKAYQAADIYQVVSNWLVGRRIVEQEQHGRDRAEYGKRIIELASDALTAEYGKGYSATTLRNYRKFYLSFKGLQIQQPLLADFKRRTAINSFAIRLWQNFWVSPRLPHIQRQIWDLRL